MDPTEESKRFALLYADPPWDYKGQKQHGGAGTPDTGGAATHYDTLKLRDLKRLNVADVCEDDCLLFMWATGPHLDQAVELMKAWGFAWATIAFVWNKARVNPGFYTMSQVELVLVGKRGRIPKPRGARNIRQYVLALRGPHSVKPPEVRTRIEAMFPEQNKLELFARQASPGWSVWGNEVEPDVRLTWGTNKEASP